MLQKIRPHTHFYLKESICRGKVCAQKMDTCQMHNQMYLAETCVHSLCVSTFSPSQLPPKPVKTQRNCQQLLRLCPGKAEPFIQFFLNDKQRQGSAAKCMWSGLIWFLGLPAADQLCWPDWCQNCRQPCRQALCRQAAAGGAQINGICSS